jgi:hypothetical protein
MGILGLILCMNVGRERAKRAALIQALGALLPAWMAAATGVGSEFVVGSGVVGQTLL